MSDLHDAVTCKDLPAVEKALAKENVNSMQGGWTALHGAVFANSPKIALFLLTHGADVNAKGQSNETPLHIAAARGDRSEIAKILLAHGADLRAKGTDGMTPLDWAKRIDIKEMVELLENPPVPIKKKSWWEFWK